MNWKKTVVFLAIWVLVIPHLMEAQLRPLGGVISVTDQPFIVTDITSMSSTDASGNSGYIHAHSIPFSGPIVIYSPGLGQLWIDNVYTDGVQRTGVLALGLDTNVIIQPEQTLTVETDMGTIDAYLPELRIGWMSGSVAALFYVAADGSTYHSRSDHNCNYDTNGGEHFPDLTPQQAMVPEHLARAAPAGMGYFIIVAGRGSTGSLQEQINYGCNEVFKVLREVGFSGDRIYYMNPWSPQDVDGDGLNDIDNLSSSANLKWAIETWASSKVGPSEPLFLYLFDHGGSEVFCIDAMNGDLLSSTTLESWFNTLEEATNAPIHVIYAACHSGSFIDELSGKWPRASGSGLWGYDAGTSDREKQAFIDTPGIASGIYLYCKVREIRIEIQYGVNFLSPPALTVSSTGYDGRNPHEGSSTWCDIVEQRTDGCILKTYVYYVGYTIAGEKLDKWIPGENAQFSYTATGRYAHERGVIVCSSRPEQSSYVCGNWECFSLPFWRQIQSGHSVARSFNRAVEVIQTQRIPQDPLLDDNGDVIGHTGPLPNGGDGDVAFHLYIGSSSWVFPWIRYVVAKSFYVWPPPPIVTLWAKVENKTPLLHVGARMIPPDWTPPPPDTELIDPRFECFEMTDLDHDGNFTVSIPAINFTNHASGPSDFKFVITAEEENGMTAIPLVTEVGFVETFAPPDDIPPRVYIERPIDGRTIQYTISINGTGIDDVCLQRVEFYVNDNLVGAINVPFTSNSFFEVDFDTLTIPNGPATILVKAFDISNNSGTQTLNVMVNNFIVEAWSTDSLGHSKSVFLPSEEVFVRGRGFPAGKEVTIHIIPDGEDASPGNAITSNTSTTDVAGGLPVALAWPPPLTFGKYDIWVDVNQNDVFDEGDVCNDQAISVFSFFVIPEPSVLISTFLMFSVLITFYFTRKRKVYFK